MRFIESAVSDAEGAILAHAARVDGRLLRKGHVLAAADVDALARTGRETVTVARMEPGDIDENTAAARIAEVCAGENVRVGPAFTGRVNLYATLAGVALIDAAQIARLNDLDESITVATVAPYTRMAARQML